MPDGGNIPSQFYMDDKDLKKKTETKKGTAPVSN